MFRLQDFKYQTDGVMERWTHPLDGETVYLVITTWLKEDWFNAYISGSALDFPIVIEKRYPTTQEACVSLVVLVHQHYLHMLSPSLLLEFYEAYKELENPIGRNSSPQPSEA